MSCCSGGAGNAAFYAGNRWHELECEEGKVMRLAEQMEWPNPYDNSATEPLKSRSCECGSDKTYGEGCTTHTVYCPKYLKR